MQLNWIVLILPRIQYASNIFLNLTLTCYFHSHPTELYTFCKEILAVIILSSGNDVAQHSS